MKQESRFKRFKVFGVDCAIQHWLRTSTAEPVKDAVFWFGNSTLKLSDNLPRNIAQLIPRAYLRPDLKGEEWEAFVTEAQRLHYLN